jgi:hypothetical protein
MEELGPQTQTSGDMGQEPPNIIVGTAMYDSEPNDKTRRALELIRQMDASELRELHAGFTSLLNL